MARLRHSGLVALLPLLLLGLTNAQQAHDHDGHTHGGSDHTDHHHMRMGAGVSPPSAGAAQKKADGFVDPRAYYPAQPYRSRAGNAAAKDVLVYPTDASHLRPHGRRMQAPVEEEEEPSTFESIFEWQAEVTAMAAAVRKAVAEYNESNSRNVNDNYDPFWPACPIFDAANTLSESTGCRMLKFFRRFVVDIPQNYSHPMMPLKDEPMDPKPAQPFLLDARGNPAPRMLNLEDVKDELPTYHFLYRLIFRLVKYTFIIEDSMRRGDAVLPPMPQLVKGYKDQKVYWMRYPLKGSHEMRFTPYAVSMVSEDGERMIVLCRGTIWEEEWALDYKYSYSTDPLAAKVFPNGHVHDGLFQMFKMVYADLEKEARRVKPKHVLIGGHSLGGAQALMHGYNLQMALGPDVRVDTLAIGALEAGDEQFVTRTGQVLNQRNLIFLGEGASGSTDEYRIGDVFAQYTCGSYLGCDSLGTGPTGVRWPYARAPVQVPFWAKDIPNTDRFLRAENMFLLTSDIPIPSFRNMVAGHICSYACLLGTAVDDPHNLCLFKDQPESEGIPEYQLCYFPELLY